MEQIQMNNKYAQYFRLLRSKSFESRGNTRGSAGNVVSLL